MNEILLLTKLELKSNIKTKWFISYCLIFALLLALFFITGISNSAVLGFTGLSRTLLLYIQIIIIILPIFILIQAVKGICYERQSGQLECMLSFPIKLSSFYFGKLLGRFILLFTPVIAAMLLACLYAFVFLQAKIDIKILLLFCALIFSLCACFLGLAFGIGANLKSQNTGLGLVFFIWILLIGLLDIAFLGIMIQDAIPYEIIISLALLNPLQDFRIAALALFNPSLSVMGQSAYFILDNFSKWFLYFSVLYPLFLGALFALLGYLCFKRRDLL